MDGFATRVLRGEREDSRDGFKCLHFEGIAAGRAGEVGRFGVDRGEAHAAELVGTNHERVGQDDGVVDHQACRDQDEPTT